MEKNIQLYLVSGFLGSGKTTFLRQLLLQMQNVRVGVIVNEFGSIGIDGKVLQQGDTKMVEINNGSIFCACLKDGFVKTLVAFLEQPIDVLFIEASGMADPSSMEHLLKQMEFMASKKVKTSRRYDYCGAICLIDAGRFLDFCDLFTPTQNQAMKSMFHVLNKTDEASPQVIEELRQKLHELNPNAYIYETTYGKVPFALMEQLVNPESEVNETCNSIWNRPETYILEMQDLYPIDAMKQFCQAISEQVLRCKGFFKTPDKRIMHIDNVGTYQNISEEPNLNTLTDKEYKLVLIGKNEKPYQELIQQTWEAVFGSLELRFYDD